MPVLPGAGQGNGSSSLESSARIVVTLPADARLTVDDQATTSVGTRRVFYSTPLPADGSYSYTFKAEFVQDGKRVSVTKKVPLSPGKEIPVSFGDRSELSVAGR
jgi:uncharacterized protein (TIGR03000 family)